MNLDLFFPPGTRILALPNWRNPRLYLPAQQSFFQRWNSGSLYPAFRIRTLPYRFLLRIKASIGLVAVRTVHTSDWPLGEFIRDVLPGAHCAALLEGHPGPTQKCTVQLRDENGIVLGYLKYAEKEAARKALQQERRMLSGLPEVIAAPKLLKHGLLGNGDALLISPLSGKHLPAALPPVAGLYDFLMSFVVLPPVPIANHPWVQHIRGSSEHELDNWFEALSGKDWPVVIHHGDFAPWNVLRKWDGGLAAIDWERGTLQGFPYLDLAYFILQTSLLIYQYTPFRAAEYAAKYLTRQPQLAFSSAEARALVCLAAYDAYWKHRLGRQPSDSTDAAQRWWRAIWEGSVCAS